MRELLFIIPLALMVCRCAAADPNASPILQQAYWQMLSVRTFAFGEVEDYRTSCAMTSQGEQSFRTLVESTNGLPLFRAALTNGTLAARLYALCGIRRLAPEQFESLAAPIVRTNARVLVTVESIGMVMMSSNLVAQIRNGSFDEFCPEIRKSR